MPMQNCTLQTEWLPLEILVHHPVVEHMIYGGTNTVFVGLGEHGELMPSVNNMLRSTSINPDEH